MNQINANITTDFHPQIQVAITLLLVPLLPVPLIPPTSTSCSFCSVSVREYSATSSRFPSAPAALRARRGSCSPWTFSKSEARPTATLWSWQSQQRLNKRAFEKGTNENYHSKRNGDKKTKQKKVRRAEVTKAAAGGLRKAATEAPPASQRHFSHVRFCNREHLFTVSDRLLLTSRLRSLTLWDVFRMATSMSFVASLAWTDCCSDDRRRGE